MATDQDDTDAVVNFTAEELDNLPPITDDGASIQVGDQDIQGGQPADPEHDEDDDQRGRVDEELSGAGTEAEREQIRERRRRERKSRLAREKDRNAQLERTVANLQATVQDMGQRLASYDSQNVHGQYARLVQGEQEAAQMTQQLKNMIADATVKGDGNTVAEATEALLTVQTRQRDIAAAKQQLERSAAQPRRQPIDPEVTRLATEFQREVPWFSGVQGRDPDSRVLTALDTSLSNEGWDPKDPSYWTELRSRARKYLPHRFGEDQARPAQEGGPAAYNQPTQRAARSPVAGASTGGGSVGTNGAGQRTYRFSPAQQEAMKAAGHWGDPVAMKRMAAYYMNHKS